MRELLALLFLGLLLALGTSTYMLGDGSDPMPACRHKVCPPLDLNR